MDITVLQSCSLSDLTIKLNFGHLVMTLHLFSGNPLAFQWGVVFPTRVVETQGYLDIICTARPNASIRIPTWEIIMANSGNETLMQLGLLGKATFKAAKTLTT